MWTLYHMVIAINSWRPQFCKDMKIKCHVCDLVTPKPLAHRFYDYPRARLNVMQHLFDKKLPYAYRKFTHFQEEFFFWSLWIFLNDKIFKIRVYSNNKLK